MTADPKEQELSGAFVDALQTWRDKHYPSESDFPTDSGYAAELQIVSTLSAHLHVILSECENTDVVRLMFDIVYDDLKDARRRALE